MANDRTREEQEKDKREQMNGTPLKVLSIDAEEGMDNGKVIIKRIVLNCINDRDEEIRITHKPKVKRERFQGGLKLVRDDFAVEKADLSKSLQDIIDAMSKNGSVDVLASYMIWQPYSEELQGYKQKVRYVQYASIMDKWKIVEQNKSVAKKETYSQWLNKFSAEVVEITDEMNQEFFKKALQGGDIFQPKPGFVQRLI